MSVASQWDAIGSELPEGWARADLRLDLPDDGAADTAAAALAPAGPYRADDTVLTFTVARDGSGVGANNARRLLARIPRGTLSLENVRHAAPVEAREATSLVEAWDRMTAGLPPDWSDLTGEIELDSSDFVEKGSVLCIQMNPRRDGERTALRFRCARRTGYGVSPAMARRCLERCDAAGITGTVRVLRVISDSRHVQTQGPVWLSEGLTI